MPKNNIEKINGDGIVDFVKSGYEKVKNIFSPNSKYTNKSNATLKQYGDYPIVGMQIRRQPIMKVLSTILNIISLGNFDPKKYGGYDKLYHLFMVVRVNTPTGKKEILIEKNQSINISTSIPKQVKETEIINIASVPNLTINIMLNNTLNKVGENQYFVYDPFSNNCQRFITDVLASNNLLGENYSKWILQDLTELVKKLPQFTKSISKGVTDFASAGEKLIGGAQIMNEDDYLKVAKEIAKQKGYNPNKLKLSTDNIHKLEYDNIKFGRKGYNDFIQYLYLVHLNKITLDDALKHRENYRARAYDVMKETNNKFSPASLSFYILW